MPQLEEHLRKRWPQWFRGRRAQLAWPLLRGIGRWSRFDRIAAFLQSHGHLRGFAFVAAARDYLQLRYEIDPEDLLRIPARGRLLVVANHPSGALDALALLDCIGRVRRDACIVANDLLSLVEPLGELMLPVRILGGRPSGESLAAIEQALREERCVVIFPAGEVSRLGPRGVRDSRWRHGFLRFARATGAPVLPIRVEARNSPLFYGVSALYKPAATALLAREMFARRHRPLRLRVGWPRVIAPGADAGSAMREVRRTLYAIGRRSEARVAGMAPIAPALPSAQVRAAVAGCERLGETSDGKQVLLARFVDGPRALEAPLLRELGRQREIAFRSVGEGTRRACDLDPWDAHYEHIVLWDDAASRIVGAYRVARGAEVLARSGLGGLYTASLFRYADDAIPRIAEGLELGRSFVAADYRGGRSLDYLWQGIGAYLAARPRLRYLFGAVSISGALPREAREQLVAYYQRYHGAGEALATPGRPFEYFAAPPCFGTLDADTAYGVLRANLAVHGVSVPTLYRQYTELCEPGGARFLAFGIDPAFSDSIDGLVEVDIHRVRPQKARRWLRREGEQA